VSVCPSCAVPEIVDGAVFVGGVATKITAVWADVAVTEPAGFVAVTATRIVSAASVAVSTYVWPVAEAIGAQLAPVALQRCHAYAYVLPVPDHVPCVAVSVWPTTALSR